MLWSLVIFGVDSNINKIYFAVASAKYTICFLWSAIACVTLGRDGRVVGYQRSGDSGLEKLSCPESVAIEYGYIVL